MTSNRDTIIDDAIMSRATAWIKYDYPDPKELPEIWHVLADNYEVEMTKADIAELAIRELDFASREEVLTCEKCGAEFKGGMAKARWTNHVKNHPVAEIVSV